MNQEIAVHKNSRLVRLSVAACVMTSFAVVGVVVPATASADTPSTNPPAVQQRSASTVTADALPTVQIDSGVVWSQDIVGNMVYAGGSFSNARPAGAAAGTSLTPRSNILAYDIRTGVLDPSFAPTINGQVKVITTSPDGSRIYVGGSFTSVNGASHYNVAAFSTATGALISTFKAQVGGSYVNAIAATNTAVYVGGLISAGDGVARTNLAAFDLNGKLLGWAPTTDLQTDAMVLTPKQDKLIIGGRFSMVNGQSQRGLAALSLTDGSIQPWLAPQTVVNGTSAGKSGIYSLSADASNVYGTGWVYSDVNSGNLEGSFSADPDSGAIKWLEDCHGDTYDSYSDGTEVYEVNHAHDCSGDGAYPNASPAPGNLRHAEAFTTAVQGTLTRTDNVSNIYKDWSGEPAPAMINWFPDFVTGSFTGQGQAAWDITGNGSYLVAGGEFPDVNGMAQYGIVRFAKAAISGAHDGPRLSGSKWTTTTVSAYAGQGRVSIPQNYDRDDLNLTYNLYRTGTTTPIYTTTTASPFWNQQPLSYTDTGLTPGATYTYQWTATDGDGNTAKATPVSVTVTTASLGTYAKAVLTDGASDYWRLDQASGATTNYDVAGANDLSLSSGVSAGAGGAINDGDSASTFDGSAGTAGTAAAATSPQTFTSEAWIKTTTTSGGKIIGYGSSQLGTSGSYDRHVYMDNAGHLIFGVYNGGTQTVSSSATFNDGAWHQVVAEYSNGTMSLVVDGRQVGTASGVAQPLPYTGYWRVGGDNLGGWPNQPSSNAFAGQIDDVSVYPTVLSLPQIRQHYIDAGYTGTGLTGPSDSYGKAVYGDSPSNYYRFDELSGSTATDLSGNGNDGTYYGTVSQGQSSPVSGSTGSSAGFSGSGTVSSNTAVAGPSVYSESIWFKTTSTSGGKLIGFGDQRSGDSNNYDRHVYMLADGQLVFGTYTGQLNLATSPNAYNDGGWHQVDATQGPDGMTLYVDGSPVATNSQTSAQGYSGYWRIGGDNLNGWNANGEYFTGQLDEAAVYPTELSAAQVKSQYAASPAATNQPPVASFTDIPNYLTASFDATGSSDPDGTIASYAWTFGDGSTGTGATPSHTYATPGTYSVTLTVTDNGGATATQTQTVTVTKAPNQPPTAAFTSSTSNLTASFDGSGSSDPDGTVASYSWNFGDGTTGSGSTPSHTYAAPGTYTVSLTVTDDQGATSSAVQHSVTVTAANQPPTAAFTSSTSNLTASFDGSGSSDPDGTVASYSWNFGDNSAAGSGVAPSHTYAAPGSYSVTLTVTDNQGATANVTHSVTVTAPANQPPVAAFTSSVSNLSVALDGTSSSDPDGSIAAYAWNFGDNSAGATTATTSHTYAAPGTYPVSLTVTDNKGATSTVTHQVTVSAPSVIASDAFSRTTATGWGTADVGGAWTLSGSSSLYSTNGSVGRMTLKTAGSGPAAYLNGVSAQNVTASASVAFDSVPTGGGSWAYLVVRQSSAGNYQLAIKVLAGSTTVYLRKVVGSTTTTIASKTYPMTYTAGEKLRFTIQVTGGSPTQLAGKMWVDGTTEPTAYQVTGSDSESTLQGAGHVGLVGYLSGSSSTVPVVASFDDLNVKPA